jgi:hypothetical protein
MSAATFVEWEELAQDFNRLLYRFEPERKGVPVPRTADTAGAVILI